MLGGELATNKRRRIDFDSSKFSTSEETKTFETIKANIVNNLSKLSSSDLLARDKVINHVGESIQDIVDIESKPQLGSEELHQSLQNFQDKFSEIQENIFKKQYSVDILRHYISHIIDTMGPNRDTTALLSTVSFDSKQYLKTHTMNVLMISIATAIELTKNMKEKLLTKDVCSDLQKVMICNEKIFTREELINLGIAAILHDIYLAQKMPNLHKSTQLAFKEKSEFDRHPAEGYHFLKADFSSMDFDIKRAVYQHHEYIDGSGFPNGIEERLFSRYSLILSFSVHYVMRITENPFHPLKHPHIVLHQMLSTLRSKFDGDVLLAYTKAASLYPIGCWILLNTGQIAVVYKSHSDKPNRPVVKVLLDSKFEKIKPELIDTAISDIKIKAPVPFLEVRKRVPEYLQLLMSKLEEN